MSLSDELALVAQPLETDDFRDGGVEALKDANTFEITSPAHSQIVGVTLRSIKHARKTIAEKFDPPVKAAHKAHKMLVTLRKDIEAPFIECEDIYKRKLIAFENAENAKRRAVEEKLREEARKAAEARKIEQAIELEKSGHKDEADRLMDTPVIAPAPIVQAAPKVEGVSTRSVWKARVIDETLMPMAFLTPDLVKLGKYARAMGAKASVPGVEFYCEQAMAVRT